MTDDERINALARHLKLKFKEEIEAIEDKGGSEYEYGGEVYYVYDREECDAAIKAHCDQLIEQHIDIVQTALREKEAREYGSRYDSIIETAGLYFDGESFTRDWNINYGVEYAIGDGEYFEVDSYTILPQ